MHTIAISAGPLLMNSTVFFVGKHSTTANDGFHAIWGASSPLTTAAEAWSPYISGNTIGAFAVPNYTTANNSLTWDTSETSFIRSRVTTGSNIILSKQGSAEETLLSSSGDVLDQVNNADNRVFLLGITLDNGAGGTAGNYMLSDSTQNVWTASVNPTHHHDIIGLARDDNAFLLQKQSRTQDDSLLVFVGDLYADNQSNPQAITNNLSSILIGNDKGKQQSVIGLTKPATIRSRLERTWKVTNTSFADKFGVEIKWDSTGDFNLEDVRLLVSDSPDFTNAVSYDKYFVDFYIGSIIVKNIGTSIIPMNSTKYITIGSISLNTTLAEADVNFTAKVTTENHVALNWQTKNEVNASYFTVERSADKKNWGVVATVDASIVIVNYNAVDKKPYTGVSYHRLKQTDADGRISYSKIKTVNIISNEPASKLLVVYPNPAVSQLTVKGDAADLKSIRIFNITGQGVTGKIGISNISNTVLSFEISGLNNGTYTIKTNNSSIKFIKQ